MMRLDDLDMEEEQKQAPSSARLVLQEDPEESADVTMRSNTAATDMITEGEVGRYARKPDNRATAAQFINFGNRATHANKDLYATGVVKGAEVGEVKVSRPKPPPTQIGVNQATASGIMGMAMKKPPQTLIDLIMQISTQVHQQQRMKEPTPRQNKIVESVLDSMKIPPEAKKTINETDPKTKVAVVASLSNFIPTQQPRRKRTLSRERTTRGGRGPQGGRRRRSEQAR